LSGTVNLYHASALVPQLPVPLTVVLLVERRLPAVPEQVYPGYNVVALEQPSFPGCEKETFHESNSNGVKRTNGFFIGWTFTNWI
jgi:hypothetical protein